MTRDEAHQIDQGSVYSDLDDKTDCYGVFGTESGFCYELYSTEQEAQERAEARGNNEV